MRRGVRVLLGLTLALPLLLAVPTPCLACACAGLSASQIIDAADEVFVGTMTGDRLLERGTAQRFEVERVYRGVLPPELELYAPVGPSFVEDCALLFSPGTRVAVAVNRDDQGRPTTSLCATLRIDQVERFAGAGAPPVEGAPFPAIAAIRPPASEPIPAWVWIVLGVVLAVGLIAVSLRRRGLRRADGSDAEDEAAGPEDEAAG
jgi:hypothetical protein